MLMSLNKCEDENMLSKEVRGESPYRKHRKFGVLKMTMEKMLVELV